MPFSLNNNTPSVLISPNVDLSRDQRAGQVFLIRAFFFRGNLTHSTKASEKLYTPARMSDAALYSPMHRGDFSVKWFDPPRKKKPKSHQSMSEAFLLDIFF